ncbi:MAG: OmpA family protein [Cyclobacteriaceae bacterium]
MNNIYFNFNKTSLTEESNFELDKIALFLNENKNVSCEILGHTDAFGSTDYNLILSQGRAQAVVDYLFSKGIEKSRLSAKGYGSTKPIDFSGTKLGNAKNRRVEFLIVKMN